MEEQDDKKSNENAEKSDTTNSPNSKSVDLKKFKLDLLLDENGKLDEEKLKRAIVLGTIAAGVYCFDNLTADEWFVKDEEGNFILMRRGIFKEIFE